MWDPVTRLNAALECSGMNRRVLPLLPFFLGLLVGPLGCGADADDPAAPVAATPADRIVQVAGPGASDLPGNTLADPIVVRVLDEFGNPVAGHSVFFRATTGGGSMDVSQAVTDGTGRAEASWTLGLSWGPQSAEASAPGLKGNPLVFDVSATNVGATPSQIRAALLSHPPNAADLIVLGDSTLREVTFTALDAILSDDSARTAPAVRDFYHDWMDTVLAQLDEPVTEGVSIWRTYNHGFLVKTSDDLVFAFDLIDGINDWSLPRALIDQVQILFISHGHGDHYDPSVAEAVAAHGGRVVVGDGSFSAGYTQMAPGDTLTLLGLRIQAYYADHKAVPRMYETTTADGIKILHTGDNGHSAALPPCDLYWAAFTPDCAVTGPGDHLDILLINGWLEGGTTGMINSAVKMNPVLMIPAHLQELLHEVPGAIPESRHRYSEALQAKRELPPGTRTEIRVMAWGERYLFVDAGPTGPFSTLAVATASLPDGLENVPYVATLAATGGDESHMWSLTLGSLPTGLSLHEPTGRIWGTPTMAETQNFTVEVASGDGQTAQQALSISVNQLFLEPSDLCDRLTPPSAIAAFQDANLEAAVRAALGLSAQDDVTCGLLSGLTTLNAASSGIVNLLGIQNLTSLTSLDLSDNSITDTSPLSRLFSLTTLQLQDNAITNLALGGLTGLTSLNLAGNSISNISGLYFFTGLTSLDLTGNSISDITLLDRLTALTILHLTNNSISDITALRGLTSLVDLGLAGNASLSNIQPLLDNTGLGAGDTVNLSDVDPAMPCADVTLLQAKGVTVTFNVCS